MLISEIYQSNQGEGLLTGTPSVFIRTSGCNLRCDFCDTPFASWQPEGSKQSNLAVVNSLKRFDAKHVVITGGEPMIWNELIELTQLIRDLGLHITIETAGTIQKPVTCDLMSISPKLSNSTPSIERAGEWSARHETTRHQPDIVRQLVASYEYQLKFVVAEKPDLDEILSYLKQIHPVDRKRVMLMPEGIDNATLTRRKQWLEPECKKLGFTFCPRMHIQWYGNQRGT